MMSNKRLVTVCVFITLCNVAALVLFFKFNAYERCVVTINEHQEVSAIVSNEFLSIGIDTSELENNRKIDFTKSRFRKLAAALAPARLRIGGTMSERLIFTKEDQQTATCEACPKNNSKFLPFFLMSGKKWTEINEFCKATKMKLLFSVNVMLRDDGGWNDQNAIELIQYSKHRKFHVDWQLGNEPNSFKHVFNVSISAQTLAHDFKHLRQILNRHGYKHALLVGPDTTRPQEDRPECLRYMIDFLSNGSHYINARSWHQYYLNSRTAKLEDFWKPETLDLLKAQLETMHEHTSKYAHIPMWLTETSSSYGGGAPGLSNSFAASPLWLDKLGLAARYNVTTVVRQSFFGGNYSLIDSNLNPLPDWWVSVIYKKLVGNKVLYVNCQCSRFQRMYAHCASRKYTNDTTAVTIFAVNLEMAKAKFLLNGTALHGDNLSIDEYIISAPSNNRYTKTVHLNGWPLYYESSLPDLEPNHIKYGNHISMPPYSIGFWVIKNTSIKVCK